jgi:hypothetical protein
VDDDLWVNRAEKEVVLILVSDTPRVREAKKVELVVARPQLMLGGAPTGERCGESHEIITGGFLMRHDRQRREATSVEWTGGTVVGKNSGSALCTRRLDRCSVHGSRLTVHSNRTGRSTIHYRIVTGQFFRRILCS